MSSSTEQIHDEEFNTLVVHDDFTAASGIFEGDLTVLGTITPNVPGSVPDPLSVDSLIVNITADIEDLTLQNDLTLMQPEIVNNNSSDNTTMPISGNSTHSTVHLKSDVNGTASLGVDDRTLLVTCERSTACSQISYAIESNCIFSANALSNNENMGAIKGTFSNTNGGNTSNNVCSAISGEIAHTGAGTIQTARINDSVLNCSAAGTITTATGNNTQFNITNNSTITKGYGAVYKSTIDSVSQMTNWQGVSIAYENFNTTASNATYVSGLVIGTSDDISNWESNVNAVTNSRAIEIGPTCNIGDDHKSINILNGSGALRTSGTKNRYRLLSSGTSETLTINDDYIYVNSTTLTTLNLPALPSTSRKTTDETLLHLRNEGPNNVTVTASSSDVINPLGNASSASTFNLNNNASITLQATTAGDWRVTQQSNITNPSGTKFNFRFLNTLSTETMTVEDNIVYVDTSTVNDVELPVITTSTENSIFTIRNDGPNSVNVNSSDLIDELNASSAVSTVSLPAYQVLGVQATNLNYKVIQTS